jgi:hypothetical protein
LINERELRIFTVPLILVFSKLIYKINFYREKRHFDKNDDEWAKSFLARENTRELAIFVSALVKLSRILEL